MRTAIINLTYARPGNLGNLLRELTRQTRHDFTLIVSNSNRDHDHKLEQTINATERPFPIKYRKDSNDRLGFRRFDIARELYFDRYIFLDDDARITENFINDAYNQYEPNTYHSWYCWQILSDNYHDRARVISPRQTIHYAGTGVSMIDRSIVDRPELFNAPSAALYIEDLWLTYIVDHVYKWPIKLLKIRGTRLAAADQASLYKRVAKMPYTKTDFYRDLLATGWQKK